MQDQDPHSFARLGEGRVNHLFLKAFVNFEEKKITATATWTLNESTNQHSVVFDSKGLNIQKIWLDGDSTAISFQIKDAEKFLGNALIVPIQPGTRKVHISYETGPGADALQWLEPTQTHDKKSPFLFTQSQAILARTWVPCQDSPGIRFTYDAKISVPNGLMAVMSAENPDKLSSDGVYSFSMKNPIPSYLLALSVGKFEFTPIGPRTGVYAEPGMMKASVHEFADLEKMLETAENLYGAYAWGRYDLIVLPPSFPFGGMENPRITFCTPTIIAGDRSLTSLVAHELAHSWSGNLVTNATWNDFWLNEGFTMYFESRIMEALYGKDIEDMHLILNGEDLKLTVEELGKDSPDTHLKLNLEGRDPDDGMNDIAYIKGQYLLKRMEAVFGREKFDAFLRNHFSENAFKSMTTEDFLASYESELVKDQPTLADSINIRSWIYGPGIPDNAPVFHSTLFEKTDSKIEAFKNGASASELGLKNISTNEWLRFIRGLPAPLNKERIKDLDGTFGFSNSGNSEILAAWFEHVIRNNYQPAFPALEKFLAVTGRRKFCKPLYTLLNKNPETRSFGKMVFEKSQGNYHPITRESIRELLEKG